MKVNCWLLSQDAYMYIGLTTTEPPDWNRKSQPWKMRHTWCLCTWDGDTRVDRRKPGYCDRWREQFGSEYMFTEGDVVTLTLCEDRSVSIAIGQTKMSHVFTDLPYKPLWVVIYMWVKKIEILQCSKYM